MRESIKGILFGRNALLSGMIALAVVGAVALGCTCNEKDGFNWGSNSSSGNSTSDEGSTPEDTKPVKKADASKGEVPEGAELDSLVKGTLLDFNNALQEEDFTDFHGKISSLWAKQITPRQLKKTFQALIDGKMDISVISGMKPDYTSTPSVDNSERLPQLKVKGEFNTSPLKTEFDLTYIPDGDEWKLFGIEIYGPKGKAR